MLSDIRMKLLYFSQVSLSACNFVLHYQNILLPTGCAHIQEIQHNYTETENQRRLTKDKHALLRQILAPFLPSNTEFYLLYELQLKVKRGLYQPF